VERSRILICFFLALAVAPLSAAPAADSTEPSSSELSARPLSVVHVSSIKSKAGAAVEGERYETAGYPIVTRREEVPGKGSWYRVYLGPYPSRESAKRVAEEVRSAGLTTYAMVQRWEGDAPPSPSAPGPDPHLSRGDELAVQGPEKEPGGEPGARLRELGGKTGEPSGIPRRVEETQVQRWNARVSPIGGGEGGAGILEVYPNPDLGRTILFARLPEPISGEVRGTIQNLQGNPITELEGTLRDGSTLLIWDSGGVGAEPVPGPYVVRLETEEIRLTAEFVIRR
jgi:hypothetical protein